ncbi:hypothetical protein [Synechococcus sp. 1G10]|nr:hypothetical protein [Synechococcus sp. 1G10]
MIAPVERIAQRFDLPHQGLAHQYLNHSRCLAEHRAYLQQPMDTAGDQP